MRPRPETAAARRALTRGKRHELPRGIYVAHYNLHYVHNYMTCTGEVDILRTLNASGTLTLRLRCSGCGFVEITGTDG